MGSRNSIHRSVLRGGGISAAKDVYTQHYLRLLVTILVSFFTTAILIYPEKFLLGAYPFSYLGRRTTPLGLPNIYSRIVFDTGMLLCAYTMFLLARYHHRKHPVPDSALYEFLSYISALGFLFMIVPCDPGRVRFLHSIGSGFVVGSHFFMATIRVVAVHVHLRSWLTFILLSTLILAVVLYAILWFFKFPNHALFQKPAFVAIIYVELYGSHLSRFLGEYHLTDATQSEHQH
jgi:hypothetical protein